MSIQFKFVYMYSKNALDITKCANKRAVNILGGALHDIHVSHNRSVRISEGWIRGVKGFLLYTLEDPGVIKARPHIMYLKGLTSNAQSILPTWRSSRLCGSLIVTCVSLDGGGVCSSRADELATLALSSQTKVPALACLISSSYV